LRHQGGKLSRDLEILLTGKNGFFAFESALHVLPTTRTSGGEGLDSWNAPSGWRSSYGGLAIGYLFFAEDIFGNQFGIKDGRVVSFNAETAECEIVADSVEQWAKEVLGNFELMTGYPIGHAWQEQNGPLADGFRLVPRQPFVLGGAYAVDNLRAIVATRGMRWRGQLASEFMDFLTAIR
jgi:hypothetical protein